MDKLKESGSYQLPYKLIKELAIPDRPKAWKINSLKPGMDDGALANDLAAFFCRITDEFEAVLPGQYPTSYENPFQLLLPHEVAQRIRSEKKAKSVVLGDVLPQLASKFSDFTAIPATRIMNFAFQKKIWPTPWKLETQTLSLIHI